MPSQQTLIIIGVTLCLAAQAFAQDSQELSGFAPVDEFNPAVRVKDGSESKPVRGGTLRVRVPGDPKSLNPMCDNDSPTRQVHQYLRNDLVERDPETFEWLPMLARWFEIRDTVELTDGTRLEGRIISEDDAKVIFAPGVSRITIGEHDLERFETADGKSFLFGSGKPFPTGVGTVVPKKDSGIPTLRGSIVRPPGGRYTVWIEQLPTAARTITRKDIAFALEGDEGAKQSVLALRREVAFLLHLRKGVLWHDRQPLTADDVIFSFDTIMNPAVDAAELRQYFEDLDTYEKVDDHTVHFRYKRQYFLAFGACVSSAYVYPKHRFQPERFDGAPEQFGKHFNEHKDHSAPVGVGPYKFSKWERGKIVEIVRNDDWWCTPMVDGQRISLVPWVHPLRPFLDRIRWIIINNKAAALKALRNGEVDADFDIEPSTWTEGESNGPEFLSRFVRARFLQPLYTYIGWNQSRKGVGPERQFFADHRVRQAMTLLIPRRKILAEIHHGLGEIVTGPFFKYGPFADPSVRFEESNLRRAQLLLDAAGWIDHDGDGIRDRDGVSFRFDYVIHNMRDYHQKIADIVKESVERAGVRMSIRKLDWAVFVDTIQDQQFDAVRFAWGEPSCIDTDPFQIWHSSQAEGRGSNYISFANEEADRLILTGRRELDIPTRQRLFKRLHRLLAREQPYTFLFNFYSLYFYSRKFRNVRFCVIGEDPYVWSEWYIPKDLQGD